MFESMKNLNFVTRSNLERYIRTMKKNPKYVLDEQQRYFAYIRALYDMDIITEKENNFLFDIGQYIVEKYSFHWSREMIKRSREDKKILEKI